jgi:ParB-like chromosome segregation protein Spo0J
VYRVGDKHYVRDGHHRVSVSRALGAESIDAQVVELGRR